MPGQSLFAFDMAQGRRSAAGADEAGRGCLAGPLVAAGVRIDYSTISIRQRRSLSLLDDSKKHTPARREQLYDVILGVASCVSVVVRTAADVDRVGLHLTNLNALGVALQRVDAPDTICMSDGFTIPDLDLEHLAIVRGDATSAAVAAASIIAKVTRDRFMRRMANEHVHWGFDEHFGYSTPLHRERIEQHGLCELHRRSFNSVAYRQLTFDPAA